MRRPTRVLGGAGLLISLLSMCRPDAGGGVDAGPGDAPEVVEPPDIDREPNNRLDQAVDPGEGGRGTLRGGDVDVYALGQASQPRVVTIESEPAGAISLDVLDQRDALGVPGPSRGRVVVAAADVLVVVRATSGQDVDYRLRLEPLALPDVGTLALEPNHRDLPLRLPPNRFPARVAGFWDGPDDADAVRVEGLRSDRPTTVEIAPLPGHRPVLRLLSPAGELLASVTAERAGEGVGIPNLAPSDGIEAVLIELADANAGTSERPWTLSLHRADLGPVGELEPNDTDATARRLVPLSGRFDLAGLFHRTDDVDVFRLRITETAAVTLTLAPAPTTNAALTWREPNGETLPLDLAGAGAPEMLCARRAEPGVYAVEVSARGLDGSFGRYQLTGRIETGAFEREPNDGTNASGVVDVPGSIRGYLASPGDVDVYRLSLIAPIDAQASQRITVEPPVGVDVAVEVIDEDGAAVVRPTDDAGRGQRETVNVPLGLIRYFLIVRPGAGGGASCDAPYEVRLD